MTEETIEKIHEIAVLEKKIALLLNIKMILKTDEIKHEYSKELSELLGFILLDAVYGSDLNVNNIKKLNEILNLNDSNSLEIKLENFCEKYFEIDRNIKKIQGRDTRLIIEELAKLFQYGDKIFQKQPIGYVFSWITFIVECIKMQIPIPILTETSFNELMQSISSNKKLYNLICDFLTSEVYYPLGTIAKKKETNLTQMIYRTLDGDQLIIESHDLLAAKKIWNIEEDS